MKLEYDKEADAAYLYLEHPPKDGTVKKTVEFQKDIILDFSHDGKLLGVEVLNASKHLSKQAILDAERA
ncbi:DUF2283 domain-containing protein [Candidatus Woesearchaeota archaeon]|nr:MAG: DUF2283 domain-containing protein [Candidatus Woesearchaeota archaeon]